MANAPTVVSNATSETPRVGNVLEGLKFFVVQRVPRRTGLLKDIGSNGGQIVKIEAQSDYVIADHLRKDAPGGSYSYTLIDSALKNGELPNPADHATGGTHRSERPVGSTVPGKLTRTPFTTQDDKDLWEFVEEAKQDGASVKGNEVYKQLEKVNPRHTFQAWRDRYVKRLMDKPPPPGARAPTNTMEPPTPAVDNEPEETDDVPPARQASTTFKRKRRVKIVDKSPEVEQNDRSSPEAEPAQDGISDEDFATLIGDAEDIENVPRSVWWDAWGAFQQAHPHRTAEEWSSLYITHVRPVYRTQRNEAAAAKHVKPNNQHNTRPNGVTQKDTANGPSCAHDKDAIRSASSTPDTKKRKRTGQVSSPVACAASHKRQKAVSTHANVPADEDVVLTSDLNRDAEQQFQHEAAEASRTDTIAKAVHSDALPTSDANMAADLQLFAEAAAQRPEPESLAPVNKTTAASSARIDEDNEKGRPEEQNDRDLLTSEANKDADEQLREIMQDDDDDSEVQSQIDVDDSEVARDADDTVVQLTSATSGSSTHSGHALTEANLASQQAEHKPNIPRATDLPPDEDEKDQSDFIDYLQTTLSKTKSPRDNGGTAGAGAKLNGLPVDVPTNFWQAQTPSKANGGRGASVAASSQRKPTENIYISQLRRRQQEENSFPDLNNVNKKAAAELKPVALERVKTPDLEEDLPMSSQQELEDALDNNLNWPASPQQHRSQQSSQSQAFETQIAYPRLDPSLEHTGLAAPDFQMSSQSVMSQYDQREDDTEATPKRSFQQQQVNSQARLPDAQDEYGTSRSVEDEPATLNALLREEDEDGEGDEEGFDAAVDHDDDVDLTIVEPDGGFLDPESPGSELKGEAESAANTARRPDNEPITISSAASSSSPYQASENGEPSAEAMQRTTGRRQRPLETQDILNAETQVPDLSMAEPSPADDVDGDDRDDVQSQAPATRAAHAATQRRRNSKDDSDTDDSAINMDTWILSMKARGFGDKAISRALRCTSYRPHLAQTVLFEEKHGRGLPDDTSGIWSKLEDEILEGGDARKLRQLSEKHGSAECDERLEFLSQWRAMFPGKS